MTPVARSRAALLLDVERERGRRSLAWFVRHAWPLVEQGQYLHNWHIDCVSEHLQAVTRGEIRRLVLNQPPGSMKSLNVCVFWSAWQWIIDPSLQQLFTSFDANLTRRDGIKVQEILASEWFRERWGHRVKIDPTEPGGQFYSYAGNGLKAGWRFATSVEGKTTGWHPDVKVIDDPSKPREVSKESLDKVIQWHKNTFASRARNPNEVREILIMQRLAQGDLADYLLAKGDAVHVSIPLEYEPKRAFSTPWGKDPRTEEGESFWHDRFTPEVVEQLKKDMDPATYNSQEQQDPTPDSGSIFLADWLGKAWVKLPAMGQWIQSWDMTFKGEQTSDWVVGQLWFSTGAEFFLIDQYREKVDFAAAAKAVQDAATDPTWGKAGAKLIEDKANGPAILSHLRGKVPGLEPIKVDGNAGKVARARAVTPYFKAGNVYLPSDAPWLFAYRQELIRFPRGRHDDQVDATTQALAYLTDPATRGADYASAMENARSMGLY